MKINDVNELSAKLNQYNKERQEIEKNIFAFLIIMIVIFIMMDYQLKIL